MKTFMQPSGMIWELIWIDLRILQTRRSRLEMRQIIVKGNCNIEAKVKNPWFLSIGNFQIRVQEKNNDKLILKRVTTLRLPDLSTYFLTICILFMRWISWSWILANGDNFRTPMNSKQLTLGSVMFSVYLYNPGSSFEVLSRFGFKILFEGF